MQDHFFYREGDTEEPHVLRFKPEQCWHLKKDLNFKDFNLSLKKDSPKAYSSGQMLRTGCKQLGELLLTNSKFRCHSLESQSAIKNWSTR